MGSTEPKALERLKGPSRPTRPIGALGVLGALEALEGNVAQEACGTQQAMSVGLFVCQLNGQSVPILL
jgi:hypothetical protein